MSEDEPEIGRKSSSAELIEEVDFYFEDGLMVLTERFLRERGYCCGNRCRHCPYGHVNVPDHNK